MSSGPWLILGICSLSVSFLHEILLVPVLMYGSETILVKEERSRIRGVQMDYLKGLLDVRRVDRIPNAWIREFCWVKKGLDERIDEGVLRPCEDDGEGYDMS